MKHINAIKLQIIFLVFSLFVIIFLSAYVNMKCAEIIINLSISLGAGAISAFLLAINDYWREQLIFKKLVRSYKDEILFMIDEKNTNPNFDLLAELKNTAKDFRHQVSQYSGSRECDDFLNTLGECIRCSASNNSIRALRKEANRQKN